MKPSMSKQEREWIFFAEDIHKCCQKIIEYTAAHTFESFVKDAKTIDAVIRNLEVIGEAAKHIPQKIKLKYNKVEWAKITGFRNFLIHDYFGIEYNIVWDSAVNRIPKLIQEIESILNEK